MILVVKIIDSTWKNSAKIIANRQDAWQIKCHFNSITNAGGPVVKYCIYWQKEVSCLLLCR